MTHITTIISAVGNHVATHVIAIRNKPLSHSNSDLHKSSLADSSLKDHCLPAIYMERHHRLCEQQQKKMQLQIPQTRKSVQCFAAYAYFESVMWHPRRKAVALAMRKEVQAFLKITHFFPWRRGWQQQRCIFYLASGTILACLLGAHASWTAAKSSSASVTTTR